PVLQITQRAQQISAQSLHVRLEAGHGKDEMSALANTFNHMLDRLETSFESQNNFISNASHELSTPLTSIIGEAEWALLKERSPQEYQQALQTIQAQAERLDKITKSLLSLAQTGFDSRKEATEWLRVDELLHAAKEQVDHIYPQAKVRFDFSLMPENDDRLQIKGNAPLLQMAFTNLLMNACKYSNGKLVTISIAAATDKVVVVIKDDGIGIPQKDLPYIFDPFFRASNTIDYKGYGIGLPLTRNIIRMHQGDIQVSSQEGQGTTIVVRLPANDAQAV
ncbi:MAG TPA: HAMP domain-containing sensor histidine kinase, partial [Phnomibacter sp.]|nr:HAMP domain-containing sensor histidine kinase [Phnomibacter sp.]